MMADDQPKRRKGDTLAVRNREYWTARGVIPRWQFLLVYLIIGTVSVVGFARIGNQATRAEKLATQTRALTLATNRLARENARLTTQIQQQRIENIRTACEDQNRRHDRTVESLDLLVRRSTADRRTRAEAHRRNTIIVQAIAPRRNCDALVARSTSP